MADKIGLPFLAKFKAFGDLFLRIRNQHKRILNVVCRDNSHHLLKYLFGICLCTILISPSKVVSNLFQNGYFPIFSLFRQSFFVTIAMVKVESIPDFYT